MTRPHGSQTRRRTRPSRPARETPDPLLALEDAVREHAPDRVVVVTRPEDDAGWLERRAAAEPAGVVLGVPVTRVLLGADGSLQVD